MKKTTNLPKFNSQDGRYYLMTPDMSEKLSPFFDQCIQDAIDGKIIRLDSLYPPVVVSSEGAPFGVHYLAMDWAEAQRAETLDAEQAIAFCENLRRQSRWGEIDHPLLNLLKRELQEKYFVVTGNEDDHYWDREYSLKPDISKEEVPEPLLRFACYVAVSYKVYGASFEYLDTNYLFGLVEKIRPDMVKKLKENGTGRLPLHLQKKKTEHITASANDAFAIIRIIARDSTEQCYCEVLNYLCLIRKTTGSAFQNEAFIFPDKNSKRNVPISIKCECHSNLLRKHFEWHSVFKHIVLHVQVKPHPFFPIQQFTCPLDVVLVDMHIA